MAWDALRNKRITAKYINMENKVKSPCTNG